jgi:release factor glutamine methyltransferase
MNIKNIISQYSPKLKKTSSSPILDIELLLTKILNKPKEFLFTYPEKNLTTLQLAKFKKLFKRRLAGEPISYILGYKEFFKLDFIVNKNVLIPRPETEILVAEVLNFYKKNKARVILEIGVGSGAVIIALAKNIRNVEFIATDISAKALNIAKQNAKRHNAKIKFLKGNILEPIFKIHNSARLGWGQPRKSLKKQPSRSRALIIQNSIIVANLPYLDHKEENLLPSANTIGLKFEPKIAYDGGPDGLKYFRQLFAQIQKNNLKPKAIFLEIGYKQATKIKKIARLALPKYKSQIIKDLCGHDRVLILAQ